MRYDDMIGTVLDQPLVTAGARAAAWAQVVDLVGQGRGTADMAGAYHFLETVRAELPARARAEAARMLAGRPLPAALVRLFAGDRPAIAATVLASCRLRDGSWATLLPSLSPTARGVLRNRRDLDADARRALEAFGATDLVLGAPDRDAIDTPAPAATESAPADVMPVATTPVVTTPVAAPPVAAPEAISETVEPVAAVVSPEPPAADLPAPEPLGPELSLGGVSISALMQRIDAYRQDRPWPPAVSAPAARAASFRFETDGDGIFFWVEGVPREAIVGETLAEASRDADHGVDGHAAGAFRRRSPFRDARLAVAGAGPAAGDWRISAVPFFAPADGRFMGYRGSARRPRADEIAQPARRDGALLGHAIAPDSLRQLVHELRTPLNAIVGFAEMIEGQMLGPVGIGYRDQAATISGEGRRLLAAVDDLDMAARIEGDRLAAEPDRVDPVALLAEIEARHPGRTAQDPHFEMRIAAGVPALRGDRVVVERMLSRLLAAAIGLAAPGEQIAVVLDHDVGGGVRLTVARPARLAERDERALLDPGYAPDGDWPDAPLLGLGFSLRLVRNLAAATGGALLIEDDRFVLRLPADHGGAEAGEG